MSYGDTPNCDADAYLRQEFRRQVTQACDAILAQRIWQPAVAIVLGSGLGELAGQVEHATSIPYSTIPHFSPTRADGHAGRMILGYLSAIPVVVLQGRSHRYEGFSDSQVSFPVHSVRELGARILITTNAAGGLNPRFRTGDLMLIDSHINLLWSRRLGEGDLSNRRSAARRTAAYDWELIEEAKAVARKRNISLHQGCYLATLGPSYETRSEYRAFRWMGADAVGMSTVPEVLAAQSLAMRTLAFSVITNVASTNKPKSTTHAEVVKSGMAVGPVLWEIIRDLLQEMAGYPD